MYARFDDGRQAECFPFIKHDVYDIGLEDDSLPIAFFFLPFFFLLRLLDATPSNPPRLCLGNPLPPLLIIRFAVYPFESPHGPRCSPTSTNR